MEPLIGNKLIIAYFSNTLVSDLEPLKDINSLEAIYFDKTQVTDASLVSDLVNLIYVFCSDNSINDIDFSRLSKLERLDISNTNIKDISTLNP